MQRDLDRLSAATFDLIVIGAGIHGACVARDAALRGLSVAVVERGDFGGETSHNSLKTIHGGIRYLQHLNLSRTRSSIREQTIWLKTAPHLMRPLPFVMPTYGHGLRGPAAMFAGLQIYRMLGLNRNAGLAGPNRIRPGRVLGRTAARAMIPDAPDEDLSGAALWDDAQVRFADRAVLEILADAARHGAVVANYAEAREIICDRGRATGVTLHDRLTGATHDVAGAMIVNAAGPWAGGLARDLPGPMARLPLTISMNIVTTRAPRDFALSIKSSQASDSKLGQTKRLYFEVPWEGCAIFGTTHAPARGTGDAAIVTEADITGFIAELNAAWPGLDLSLDDVSYCYRGLTPAEETDAGQTRAHESRVIDHAAAGGAEALATIIGVKWTTARLVAEQAVDLAVSKLGRGTACRTREAPLPALEGVAYDLAGKSEGEIARICAAHKALTQTHSLRDMLLRRSNDLVRGQLDARDIACVAEAMRRQQGWTAAQCRAERARLLEDRWLPAPLRTALRPDRRPDRQPEEVT